jgi:hypothetical protein
VLPGVSTQRPVLFKTDRVFLMAQRLLVYPNAIELTFNPRLRHRDDYRDTLLRQLHDAAAAIGSSSACRPPGDALHRVVGRRRTQDQLHARLAAVAGCRLVRSRRRHRLTATSSGSGSDVLVLLGDCSHAVAAQAL